MKLVVGLGNPGKDYQGTRHNAGFLALDFLVAKQDLKWKKDAKRQSEIAQTQFDGQKVIFAKPQTFMNASGDAVLGLMNFYKIETKNVLIIQDDLDLEPSALKLTAEGNHAGHKGISDIQKKLGTNKINRLRFGIGHPKNQAPVEDYVLEKIEKVTLEKIALAPEIIKDWIERGIDEAMNRWNRK